MVDAAGCSRIADLLRLFGWDVREATGTRDALGLARRHEFDLVVADLAAGAAEGAALLRRLRLVGCRAHLLTVAGEATTEDRAAVAAAGALACLPKPVDAGLLLDFLRGRAGGPDTAGILEEIREVGDLHDEDVDADLMDRLQELYASALPGRLSAIADGARTGNAPALAAASTALAGTSAQLGHPDVAAVCQAITQDARRGILAHDLVVELHAVAGA